MIGWAIAGTGDVAQAFAGALTEHPDATIQAIGSRDVERAHKFAAVHGASMWARYEDLMTAPFVDVVYIATPASHHYRHAMMAVQAGKHVLVEKPFTVNAAQANLLRVAADAADVFLMEAAWCHFTPAWTRLREVLDDGMVGELRMVQAAFGGAASYWPDRRPFRRDLAGGALMDGGVYPVHLAHMVLGAPSHVDAAAEVLLSGVDGQVAITLAYGPERTLDDCQDEYTPSGPSPLAALTSAITTTLDASARIYGTEGMIEIPANFTNPPWLRVLYPGREPVTYECPMDRNRFAYEIDEVHRCIEAGLMASNVLPPITSCEVMGTLDRARECIGLRFPDDVEAVI